MNLNLDLNKVIISVVASAIVASSAFAIGAILEFQDVKKKVNKHEGQLSVVSQIVCKYAIRDKLEDAEDICSSVIAK